MRGTRPYINEVVVLERNPLRSQNPQRMTVARRSAFLHSPSSGELIVRSLSTGLIALLLWCSTYGLFLFLSGVLLNSWRQGWFMVTWCYPLSLWLIALYFTVVRFLSYLDLRIRQEGWAVELKLRAEAAKLLGTTA